jgi:ubiquinol-cytochrome c reductase iron-sulfur subunit
MTAAHPSSGSRRDFFSIAAAAIAGGGATILAWPLIDQMNPAADVIARGVIDVDLSHIAVGAQLAVLWQGKPLFIRHRNADDVAAAVEGDAADLPFPSRDEERVKAGHAEWLVVVGACTFEGCTPSLQFAEFGGGWDCPCCGSQFDTSGRVRKGPAAWRQRPASLHPGGAGNLPVPTYEFVDNQTVRVT